MAFNFSKPQEYNIPIYRCANGCGHLTELYTYGMKLHYCAKCAGAYLSPETLERLREMPKDLVRKIDQSFKPKDLKASIASRMRIDPRPCPKCYTLMLPHTVGSVSLDYCGSCHSLWVDHHELLAASQPEDEEIVLHFGSKLSQEMRDMLTIALYQTEEHPQPSLAVDGTLEDVFPTFASWIR